MSRLAATVRLDVLLQLRYGFYYAAAFVTLVWVALIYPLPGSLLDLAVPFVVFTDLAVTGYYFIAGMVLFEKGERTLFALLSTPLRFWEYLGSKLATLTALATVMSLIVAVAAYGFGFDATLFVLGAVFTSLISLLIGFIVIAPFDSISRYLIPSQIPMVVLGVPLLHFFGVWESHLFYLFPTQGSLLLLGGAFGAAPLPAWQAAYSVVYGLAWVGVLAVVARWTFYRYVVAREGG
jgi:fluoroquinolone transport system permease protein